MIQYDILLQSRTVYKCVPPIQISSVTRLWNADVVETSFVTNSSVQIFGSFEGWYSVVADDEDDFEPEKFESDLGTDAEWRDDIVLSPDFPSFFAITLHLFPVTVDFCAWIDREMIIVFPFKHEPKKDFFDSKNQDVRRKATW